MKRFVAILVFAAAVLVASHVLAPAEPAPAGAAVPPRDVVAIGRAVPLVDQVNAEVERLRQRLAVRPAYPPPARNPFQFGERVRRPAAAAKGEPAAAAPAAPALPRLVAITSTGQPGRERRSAVFAGGDGVRLLTDGERIGALVVRGVTDATVDLFDPATGTTYHLSLE